jgi:hypothetical protein
MAQTSWPFENADTTETQYSQLFNRLKSSGVADVPSGTGLKVTGDSSGMNVKVASGFAIVRGFAYNSTATETLTISASSSNPRIDLVVLRLDPSVNSTVLAVLTGTPAVSPTAPTPTQTETGIYELPIGQVNVPSLATTIAAGNVVDIRPLLSDGIGIWTTAQRPAGRVGQFGWNVDLGDLERYDGSAWAKYAPTAINAANITTGTLSNDRLSGVPADKLVGGTVATAGQFLATNMSNSVVGIAGPSLWNVAYTNPSVTTTFTTSGCDLSLTSNSAYLVTVTSQIEAVAANTTATIRFSNDATNTDYVIYLPAGAAGTLTFSVYVGASIGTTKALKTRCKVSTGSGIQFTTQMNALGVN